MDVDRLTMYDDRTPWNEAHDHLFRAARALVEHMRPHHTDEGTIAIVKGQGEDILGSFIDMAIRERLDIDEAYRRGLEKWNGGEEGAPILDAWIQDRIGGKTIGDRYTNSLMAAWIRGWREGQGAAREKAASAESANEGRNGGS